MPKAKKYEPLVDYLLAVTGNEFTLSIEEIEAMVGPMLPTTRTRSYWSNGPYINSHPPRWVQAETGFNTYFQVSTQKVRFKRRQP